VINDVFTIPDTGTIFHGILRYGVINVDDIVNVLCHGVITKHKVKSIHRKTLDVDRLMPGESGSITFYGNINKIDKTATIIDAMLEKNVVLKAFVVSAFEYVKLKPRQYMLFVGNNIVAVILSPSIESDIIFEVSSFNDLGFMIDSEIGILKDERQNYFFIRFV
jgi:translation elongation factor EF-1alpha